MPLALVAELRVQERAAYEELARALADHDDFLADTLISRIAELHEISVRHQPEMAS